MSYNRIRNHISLMFKNQDGKCYWCKEQMVIRRDLPKSERKQMRMQHATFDHVIPASAGGTYRLTNGVCACHRCNTMRGNIEFEAFKELAPAMIERSNRNSDNKMDQKVRRKMWLGINSFLLARFAFQVDTDIEVLWNNEIYHQRGLKMLEEACS